MKRRHLIRYTGAGLLATAGSLWLSGFNTSSAQTGGSVGVQWLGHTCFLFTGGGLRILVNPFRTLGCTAGYRSPKVAADIVLISSQLFDEGAAENLPGNPKVLYQAGVYEFGNTRFQGIGIPHDRIGGRRFGTNVAWLWQQGGLRILHLGGAAAPIELEQKILIGRPDLALVPVGGSDKAYNAQEAAQAIKTLNPLVAIPTHYRTAAADANACDIEPVEEFLQLSSGATIQRFNSDRTTLSKGSLPDQGPVIKVLSYRF